MTLACPSPASAAGRPGMPGAASVGVTASDETDAADVPEVFVAVDQNVYAVAFVSPVIGHDVAGDVTVQVKAPGDEVTK